jgi:N,N'-diacetyllegionaminate synthase
VTRTFVIAEAGVNHNGDVDLAHALIEAGAGAGADAVKFQTWQTERVVRPGTELVEYQKSDPDATDMFELEKNLELEYGAFPSLKEHCQSLGVEFLSTAFDSESLRYLVEDLDMAAVKVPSGEAVNVPFLRDVARTGRPVYLSTGLCSLDEVSLGVETLRAVWQAAGHTPALTLLQCTTAYPTPLEETHLNSMKTLSETFSVPVGFSDHTSSSVIPAVAVGMGAVVIEKHMTLDRNMDGPDHQASVEPSQFKEMIRNIRDVEKALGSPTKELRSVEAQNRQLVRRSLVAITGIEKGQTITGDMVIPLRPEDGIPARDIDAVVGKAAWQDFESGEVLKWPAE